VKASLYLNSLLWRSFSRGEWICGFSKGLGACSAYVAELWGVFGGLKLARLRGFYNMELHIDSWVVASTLALGEGGTADGWSLLQNIRRLWSWSGRSRFGIRIVKQTNVLMRWRI